MKKTLLSFLFLLFSFACTAQETSGFERALAECKDGTYLKSWQSTACTLHELEQFASRMHTLITTPAYAKQFASNPVDLVELFGNSQESAESAWRTVLPLSLMNEQEIRLLLTVLQDQEPACTKLGFNAGEIFCALFFCASLNDENLVCSTAQQYADLYYRACGLRWFPLLIAQDYGEQLWVDQTVFRAILGGIVEIPWALPNALASFICSRTQEFSVDHKEVVIKILKDQLQEYGRLMVVRHAHCK